MSKAKIKKKYSPRPIYYPKMVIAIHAFDPFEKALESILKNSQVETDDQGTYIYYDGAGKAQSLEMGLYVYTRLVEIYGVRSNTPFNVSALWMLRDRIRNKEWFDEEEVEKAIVALNLCRQVVCKIPHAETRDILSTIRTNIALEQLMKEEKVRCV